MHTLLTLPQSDVEEIRIISFFVDFTNVPLQRRRDVNLLARLAQSGHCRCGGLATLIL